MIDSAFDRQMDGYGLTTAKILYRMPDHPALLQTYLWQDYDLAPAFPELKRFLDFWRRELDGALHSVDIGYRQLIGGWEWRSVDALSQLH